MVLLICSTKKGLLLWAPWHPSWGTVHVAISTVAIWVPRLVCPSLSLGTLEIVEDGGSGQAQSKGEGKPVYTELQLCALLHLCQALPSPGMLFWRALLSFQLPRHPDERAPASPLLQSRIKSSPSGWNLLARLLSLCLPSPLYRDTFKKLSIFVMFSSDSSA